MNPLSRLQRMSVYAVGAALFLSGIAWAVLHYLPHLAGADEPAARAAAAMLMKLHGAATVLALLLLGAMLAIHVPRGWKEGRNQASGNVLLGLAGILVLSGYLLYYAGDEPLREAVSWAHLLIGIALPVPFAFHLLGRLRTRSRDESQRRPGMRCYTARPAADRGTRR